MHPDITTATPQDAEWIAGIWNAIIDGTLVTFTTTPKTVAEVVEMIATRPVLVFSDATGFATYGPFRSGPGYAATVEHTVYLAPAAQGQGQGQRLMSALMTHAAAAGHRAMIAGISGANPAAVRFHLRLGFETVGTMPQVGHKAGQWLDLILMQKMLNPPDSPGVDG